MRRMLAIALLLWLCLAAPPLQAGVMEPAASGQASTDFPIRMVPSLVPQSEHMSDNEARLALARLLTRDDARLAEALGLYKEVLQSEPERVSDRAELAWVLGRLGRVVQARAEMDRALALRPDAPDLLMSAADLEASMGHAQACRALYQRAGALLPGGEPRQEAMLRLADAANLWGDFNLIEATYRAAMKRQPGDLDLPLKLAETLVSAQRYDEAEAQFRMLLLDQPELVPALAGLADLKYRDRDYQAALEWSGRLLTRQPDQEQGLRLRAGSLFKLQRLEDAAAAYLEWARKRGRPAEAVVGLGRVRLAQGKTTSAQALFREAVQRHPWDVAAGFWAAWKDQVAGDAFIRDLIRSRAKRPLDLVAWGDVYAEQGFRAEAVTCYRTALAEDPECFPAAMNLAEVLAASQRFDEAIAELKRLDAQIPNNRKVLLAQARALSWARDYEASLEVYHRLRGLNARDPVTAMEAARVAAWAKQIDRAQTIYASLSDPPVDRLLAQDLERLAQSRTEPDRSRLLELARRADAGQGYQGYEAVTQQAALAELGHTAAAGLARLLTSLGAEYRLQKTARLESQAKALVWAKRMVSSLAQYQALVAFRPGNQEAWFDLGQVQCALGLCDQEKKTYQTLLASDPLHSLAEQALARQEIRSSPAARSGFQYWKEVGRGELAQMERTRLDLGAELPLLCRFNLALTGHRWLESPRDNGSSAEAFGHTLSLTGQVTPSLKGGLSWTRKDYHRSDLADRDSGQSELWWNLQDRVTLGGGFTREDHLANAFALAQGIQRDAWWLGIKSDLTRQWSLDGRAAWLDYSDDNRGVHYNLTLRHAFSDHPRIFKISLRADYRDTDQTDLYLYQGPRLLDITHPYWSPQDNLAGTLIFQWHHDLAKQFFCGAQQHFYDINVNLGTDTENNPAAALEAKWHYQFADHWTAEAQGLVHRSREWDAQGLWLNLIYRF